MQKWEYCRLSYGADTLSFMTSAGLVTQRPEKGETAAHLWAQLGTEGWEMVAYENECAYFKRPLP